MSQIELAGVPVQTTEGYHCGFFDAQQGEPLFDQATAEYKAGWHAYWIFKGMLQELDLVQPLPAGPITRPQAEKLNAWLRDLHAITARRLYNGDRTRAMAWFGRWQAALLQAYADGATPDQAFLANCTIRAPK